MIISTNTSSELQTIFFIIDFQVKLVSICDYHPIEDMTFASYTTYNFSFFYPCPVLPATATFFNALKVYFLK